MSGRGPDERSRLATLTSTTLLEGLRDPANRTTWRRYVDRYRPLVVRFLSKQGVPPDDAEDLAQSALLAFSQAYREGRYDRSRGRLSSWLFGIVRNHLARHRERAPRPAVGDARAVDPAGEDELERRWEAEWRRRVLAAALDEVRREVRGRTMRAFEEFALKGRPARDVARELSLSEDAVFGAKRRVLERVRAVLPLLEEEW